MLLMTKPLLLSAKNRLAASPPQAKHYIASLKAFQQNPDIVSVPEAPINRSFKTTSPLISLAVLMERLISIITVDDKVVVQFQPGLG